MRSIYRYCHNQQLIPVVLFFVATSAWGLIVREQSFAEMMKNPWRAAFPVILVSALVAIPLIIQAARELNREITKTTVENRPHILLTGRDSVTHIPTTSTAPGLIMGSLFVLIVLGLTCLAFWAGFSPAHSTIRFASYSPPGPPEYPPARESIVIPPSPSTPVGAALQFGIDTQEFETAGKLIPQTTAEFSLIDGIIAVPVTAWAKGSVAAKNVTVLFRICVDCRFAEEPKNSSAPESILNKLSDRRVHFDTIYPSGAVDEEVLKIKPPVTAHFTISCMYACDNCGPAILPSNAQNLEIYIKP